MYIPIPGGRGCKKGGKRQTAVLVASLAAATSALVSAFIGKQVQDGGPPKEFPWVPVGIAAAAIVGVAVVAVVQWRRKQEGDGKDGDGPCSQ
jgi:hypothetical protein